MELHTLGVDGGYTQKDVQEVARAFTGWTIDQPRRSGQFVFRPWMHDRGEKVVLGQRISPGGGIEDGEKVIEIVCEQMGTTKDKVTPGTSFVNDLGADSLDTVELVMEFEDEFDLSIPDEDAEKIQTIGAAVQYLKDKLEAA